MFEIPLIGRMISSIGLGLDPIDEILDPIDGFLDPIDVRRCQTAVPSLSVS